MLLFSSFRKRNLTYRLITVFLCFSLVGSIAGPSVASPAPDSLKSQIQGAKNEVYPALVNLSVVKKLYHNGESSKRRSVGSGVIISRDGYAVTNFHVVDRARKVEGTLSNNMTLEARIVGRDALTDLALLKFNPDDLPQEKAHFPSARLGNSDNVDVGDYVLAMGNPLMMSQSVTLGIVSNDNRVFFSEEGQNRLRFGDNLQTGLFTEWIQHDASISPGSSGGPLVNMDGRVIGINARGSSSGGDMGFSIPSNQVQRIVDRLLDDRLIKRSWIGVGARPLKDTNYDTGVIISSVTKGSPADRAGVQPGDRFLEIEGEDVGVKFTEQLASFYRRVADLPVGDTATILLERNGDTIRKSIRTEQLRNRRGKQASLKQWGFNIQEITPFDRRESSRDVAGVRVTSRKSGGPAENASPDIRSGDVIQSVDGETVTSFDDFLSLYSSRADIDTSPEDVLLGLERHGARLYTVLQPEAIQKIVDRPRPLGNAWIGVKTQVLTSELRNNISTSADHGVRITKIFDNTHAAKSGLRVGDVITGIDDREIQASQTYQSDLFSTMVERMTIGDTVQLRIYRDTVVRTVDVQLETAPLRPSDVSSYKQNTFDFTVRELTFFDRMRWNWPESLKGVVVTSVESGGWAGVAGLQANDLITSINGRTVTNIHELRAVLREIIRNQPETVEVQLHRKNKRWQIIIEPDWYKHSSEGTDTQ